MGGHVQRQHPPELTVLIRIPATIPSNRSNSSPNPSLSPTAVFPIFVPRFTTSCASCAIPSSVVTISSIALLLCSTPWASASDRPVSA